MAQCICPSECCCELIGEIQDVIGEIYGEIDGILQLTGFIEAEPLIYAGNIEIPTGINVETYDGAYVVIPKVVDQILETENKLMEADVLVEQIPTFWTQNTTGMTFIIGN